MEQVFFNVPLSKLEPIFKRWIKEAQAELHPKQVIPTIQPDQLLTIDEISALLHLTKATIYSKHSKGELPGVCKRGKRLYFQRDIILNWIKEGRQKTNTEVEAEAENYLKNGRA